MPSLVGKRQFWRHFGRQFGRGHLRVKNCRKTVGSQLLPRDIKVSRRPSGYVPLELNPTIRAPPPQEPTIRTAPPDWGRGSGGVKSTGVSQSVRETSRDESQNVLSTQKLFKTRDLELPIFQGSLPIRSPHSAGYTRTSVHPYFPVANLKIPLLDWKPCVGMVYG